MLVYQRGSSTRCSTRCLSKGSWVVVRQVMGRKLVDQVVFAKKWKAPGACGAGRHRVEKQYLFCTRSVLFLISRIVLYISLHFSTFSTFSTLHSAQPLHSRHVPRPVRRPVALSVQLVMMSHRSPASKLSQKSQKSGRSGAVCCGVWNLWEEVCWVFEDDMG